MIYKPKTNVTTLHKRNKISPMGDICNKANEINTEKRYVTEPYYKTSYYPMITVLLSLK